MTKPITPAEHKQLKVKQVPEFVYAAINSLLAQTKETKGKFVVSQEALKEELSRYYDNTIDMEKAIDDALVQYQKSGWKVYKSVFDWDDPEPEVIYFEAN